MKKIAYILLLAGIASLLSANAQTNPAVASQPAVLTNAATAPPADANATIVAFTNTATVTFADVAVLVTNTTVTNSEPAPVPDSGLMLIQFDEANLTTAIQQLARRANINYMLDPKIGYGLPDQNGQIKVEPTLSVRWENISAENALLALLDNYGLQLIVDKKTGIDRITMKDPTAPPPLITRVIQLQYASVSNMLDSVESTFTDKRSKVIADRRTSQMVVVATDPEQQAVDTLIKQLDTPTKQVLIETKLVEVSSQPTTAKGVNWSGTLQSQNIAFGNGILSGSTTVNAPATTTSSSSATTPGGGYPTPTPSSSQSTILNLIQGNGGFSASTLSGLIPETGFLTADGAKAVLSFLNSTYDAQIESTPRVVTLDNETATIEVTRQYPVINFSGGTQQASGSSSVTYSNVGTILMVTPRISANDKIWLKVIPEVSSHFADQNVTIPGGSGNPSFSFTVPIFDDRRINTQVLIPNGNTLVMGGLVQDNPTATYTKVPFLGDIPGLGWAFKSENKAMDKDNLIIFLTPTIVRDNDFRPAETDFLQSKPTPMKSPMNPHTMWDSGQSRGNWSNPVPVPGEFDTNKMDNF
jgi:type II secretory pathway component GspD/PulD (secretin)